MIDGGTPNDGFQGSPDWEQLNREVQDRPDEQLRDVGGAAISSRPSTDRPPRRTVWGASGEAATEVSVDTATDPFTGSASKTNAGNKAEMANNPALPVSEGAGDNTDRDGKDLTPHETGELEVPSLELQRANSEHKLQHIVGTKQPKAEAGDLQSGVSGLKTVLEKGDLWTRANSREVTNALQRGETLRFVVKTEPGGKVTFLAPPALTPRYADVAEVEETADSPPDPEPDFSAGEPTEPESPGRFYARLVRSSLTPAEIDDSQMGKRAADMVGDMFGQTTFDARRLVAGYDGELELEVVAENAPPEFQERLLEQARIDRFRATEGYAEDPQQTALDAQQRIGELTNAGNSALAEVKVVVSAASLEDLAAGADAAAAALPGGGYKFELATTPDGRIPAFTSREAAVEAELGNPDEAVVSVDRLLDLTQLPPERMAGFEVGTRHQLDIAANLKIPPGARRVPMFNEYANEGGRDRVIGPLPFHTEHYPRHVGIIAPTRMGKSELEAQFIASALEEACIASERDPSILPPKIVHLTMHKGEEENVARPITERLYGRLPQWAIDQGYGDVSVVRAGDAVFPFGDPELFASSNNPVSKAAGSVAKAFMIAVPGQEESVRMLGTYGEPGVVHALEKAGYDLDLEGSPYPHGNPKSPPVFLMARGIHQSLQLRSKFRGDIKDNAGTFVSQYYDRGARGGYFGRGPRFLPRAMLADPSVTQIDFSDIENPMERTLSLSAAWDMTIEAQKEYVRSGGKRPLIIVIDEGNEVFKPGEAGEENANTVATAGGYNISLVTAQQIFRFHPVAEKNIQSWFVIGAQGDDLEALPRVMGNTTPEQLRDNTGKRPGHGLVHLWGMNGSAPFGTTAPDKLNLGEGKVVSADKFVERGADPSKYDDIIYPKADKFIREQELGVRFRKYTEDVTVSALFGELLPRMSSGLLNSLKAMKEPDVRERAITELAESVVESRANILWATTQERATADIADYLRAQVRGDENLPDRFEWSLNLGRFVPAKNALGRVLTAWRHPESSRFEEALGSGIPGDTAEEQLLAIRVAEDKSLNKVVTAVNALSNGSAKKAVIDEAKAELAKLTFGASDKEGLAQILDHMQESQNGTPLQQEKIDAYNKLIQEFSADEPQDSPSKGVFPAVRQALVAWKDQHDRTDRVLTDELKQELERYEAELSAKLTTELKKEVTIKFSGDTARQKLKSILELEAEYLAQSDYQLTPREIRRILLPPDFLARNVWEGDTTMDNIMAFLQDAEQPQGDPIEALKRRFHGGRPEDLSLDAMYHRDDPRRKEWASLLSEYIDSDLVFLDPMTKRNLKAAYQAVIDDMETVAGDLAKLRARQQRHLGAVATPRQDQPGAADAMQ